MKLFPKSKTFLKAACFFFLLFSHQTTSNACKCINASNFDTFLHHRAASLLISLDLSTLEISIKYQMCTPKYAFAQKMQDLKNSSILWICCAFHRVFPCQKSKSTLYQLVMGQTPIYLTSNKLECVNLLVIEIQHPIFGFEQSNTGSASFLSIAIYSWPSSMFFLVLVVLTLEVSQIPCKNASWVNVWGKMSTLVTVFFIILWMSRWKHLNFSQFEASLASKTLQSDIL